MTSSPSLSRLTLFLAHLGYSLAFNFVVFASVAVIGVGVFQLNYQGRVYPGVRMWGQDLSGLTPQEAALALTKSFDYPQNDAFVFYDETHQWRATPAQLGAALDIGLSVRTAYEVGRSGNWPTDLVIQFEAWYFGITLAPVMTYDESRAVDFLNRLAPEVYEPPVEASLQADGTKVNTTNGRIGRQLDLQGTLERLRPALYALSKSAVELKLIETPPLVLDASAQAAAAQNILSAPLVLTITNPAPTDLGPWTIPADVLASWLRIQRVTAGANAARYEVLLDANALVEYLKPLAGPLERKSQNARFIFNDETRAFEVIQPAVIARELNVEATITAIHEQLAQGKHTVALVFTETKPDITDDLKAPDLGVTELVVEQSTSFLGSSAERIQNIQVAAARFHGVLVPPNGVFSFVEELGDISLDSGFAEALIIYGGRTIRGIGGGVCQVSTTVFRAAYFGGYPIVERNSHAYRVGYYERGETWKGPGLDAAVFSPIVDFKFQNDTPYWLLMETYVNVGAGRITWKFYSTSDGREVSVKAPIIADVVPAPEPQYEENAELKPGEIKQVDYSADGASVSVSRVVMRGGVQINVGEPPIRTLYQPWQAIYQYGPGTEGMPPTTPTPTPTPR